MTMMMKDFFRVGLGPYRPNYSYYYCMGNGFVLPEVEGSHIENVNI